MKSLIFPLLFYFFLGVVLHSTHGHYQPTFIVILLLLLFLSVPGFLQNLDGPPIETNKRFLTFGLVVTLFVFLMTLLNSDGLIYASNAVARRWVHTSLSIAAALTFSAAILAVKIETTTKPLKAARHLNTLIISAGFCFLLARCFTLSASPQPFIDVFTVCSQAVDYLLAGINPYSQTYRDIYNGLYGYEALPVYPPAAFYWPAPFRFVFGDIRLSFLVCDMVTAGTFALLTRNLKNKVWHLIPLLWLAFPVSLFVIEQSWNDLLVIMLAGFLIFSLEKRRLIASSALLGCLLATKQYSIFLVALSFVYIFKNWDRRHFIKAMVVTAFTAALLYAPLAFTEFNGFYKCVVRAFLTYKIRPDSISFAALIHHTTGLAVPSIFLFGAGIFAAVLSSYSIVNADKGRLSRLTGGFCCTYGFVFLFGKQAFCNYYHFVAVLLLLHITVATKEYFLESNSETNISI